jgi:uncharacterized protein (DUF608 family)
MTAERRDYNSRYTEDFLSRVAFPLGGIGAGMICLEGTGALSHVSLRGHPNVFLEPGTYAALCVKGEPNVARILEGPVQDWKKFGMPGAGNGGHGGKPLGLCRCTVSTFEARFPFATVDLSDPALPLDIRLTGWSPFVPGQADPSSLPVAGLEYRFTNPTNTQIEAIFSFNSQNFMATSAGGAGVLNTKNGFVLWQPEHEERPWERGAFSVTVDDAATKVNCAWFRGGWFDSHTMVWHSIQNGEVIEAGPIETGEPSPGGSLYVPFTLEAGASKTLTVRLAWHVPETDLRTGADLESSCESDVCGDTHRPWYAGTFADIEAVTAHWRDRYDALRDQSTAFADCFYDTTLPPEVVEAVAANLTILKSPTVLRQTDGRLWAFEGCHDGRGCCDGSCTHVWNYAQALPHLFPRLERSLRETEFGDSQDDRGHQVFRTSLPIRPAQHDFHAACDGQLGGIMKIYRDWRIGGDTDWLRGLWPAVSKSLDYCIETWDPGHKGILEEPHHNTYDIEFWGPDGMCTSFYLGALKAAVLMAEALGEEVPLYGTLLEAGRDVMESDLYDGEYFIQKIQWRDLHAGDPAKAMAVAPTNYSPEAQQLLELEGPKYQYGSGCLSDGVLGAWMARVCGVGETLSRDKERSHVQAVHRYNLKADLSSHANPQRPTYALGKEAGLLLGTWPKGGELSLPFVYSNEVWTGIEYQVASHLMLMGCVEEGLEIVRACRDRYDGRVRNPFDEYECGHWYARAMSSYGLLQGLTGIRYDAVERVLHIAPNVEGDFRSFLCTATGFGTVGVRQGKPFVEIRSGEIPYAQIRYSPYVSS